MNKPTKITSGSSYPKNPVIGVFATSDPRIDFASRERCKNIIGMVAEKIAANVKLASGEEADVIYSETLVDGEKQADIVAGELKSKGANILVCAPDTWAFPQLSLISLFQQFPKGTPLCLVCGNSGPKPGVVFAHAANGAISQYGRLVHLIVGSWADTGSNPVVSEKTETDLTDWCYAAITTQYLKGKRVMLFGHDSMGMETALAHIIPTRNAFGLEITRLDMKLLADMLNKEAYDKKELKEMRSWLNALAGKRIERRNAEDDERFNKSLAMYLIVRDLMKDLNAVGGGFMSQLEWGSDKRGVPMPVADTMESLFNSTFDHNGNKPALPYATEADAQGLLTMLFFTHLTGGNPPLFMDFRKVWENKEVKQLLKKLKIKNVKSSEPWLEKGFVDGDNSGSASFNWAAKPGASVKEIMSKVSFPLADKAYFPGMGNSVMFVSPGGIEGIAGRLAYSSLSDMFTMVWDEASTAELPKKAAEAVCNTSNVNWPHTFVVPKYASMTEYKQYAPANHLHMTWGLKPARLQYWMDLNNVLSGTPWAKRPVFIENTDRPLPLLYIING
ncbi:MAG: hypothetical protein V1752_03270, partial [Candidatus Firestonebacteria bacterium]